MTDFVDPRSKPHPLTHAPIAPIAESVQELEELHRLCREGRIYDVECWIQARRPVQLRVAATPRRRAISTALEIALETGQHGLALLLLCNGYNLGLEPRPPFNVALKARRWDLVDMLFDWGADPGQVDLSTLFDTYNSSLFERFQTAGVDLTQRHEMAAALAYHASNKPLFGFAKRHREHNPRIQLELNIALVYHAHEGNLKGTHLCLWAGADPHAPAPDLQSRYFLEDSEETDVQWSAVEAGITRGHTELLPLLRPDPSRDDFEELYRFASDSRAVDALQAIAPPRAVGAIIQSQAVYLDARWPIRGKSPVSVIEHVFKAGGRWLQSAPEEVKNIRRSLLRASDYDFINLMKLFAQNDYCSPTVLQELGRTPSIRQRMTKVGLLPSPQAESGRLGYDSHRVSGARNVATKFGIATPKTKKPLPRVMTVGRWHPNGSMVRLDRQMLYERVWSEPVDSIAATWGLSGRGLAKACKRLAVPVPPPGYWAQIQHGATRSRLPLRDSPGGHPAEVVISVPPKAP